MSLVAAVLLAAVPAPALADPPAEEKPKPREAAKVELSRLANEELLKQATAVFERFSQEHLSRQRELATAELLYAEAVKRSDGIEVPPAEKIVRGAGAAADGASDPAAALEAAKAAVERARARHAALKRRQESVQAERALLDRIAAAAEASQSSLTSFLNALDDLTAYRIEIDLRIADKTLAADKVPAPLKTDALEHARAELIGAQTRGKERTDTLRADLERSAKRLEEAGKAVVDADAAVTAAAKAYAQEQKRRETEKGFAARPPAELPGELARMVEEGVGLKGAFNLSLRRFDAAEAEAARLRTALEALKAPEAKIPQVTRAEDVEQAAKSTQELIAYYRARASAVEALQAALGAVARLGGEFEGDAAVSVEHLFRMEVLSGVVRKGGAEAAGLPPEADPARLAEAGKRVGGEVARVSASVEKAKTEAAALDKQLAEARAAGEEAAARLATLKQTQEATLSALKWENGLRGLTPQQAVESFAKTSAELKDRLEKLKPEAEEHRKAVAAVAAGRAKLAALKDPFLRAAEDASQAERRRITEELRKDAGLDRAAKDAGASAATAAAAVADAPKPAAPAAPAPAVPAAAATPEAAKADLDAAAKSLQAFQQLVAGRVRVSEERDAATQELLGAIDALDARCGSYSKALAEARQLALRLHTTAIDLKKRVGRGELKGEAVPEGITDALRRDLIDRLDADVAAALNVQTQLSAERDALRKTDPAGEEVRVLLKEVQSLVSRRLDLLTDLKRLDEDFRRERKDRPPTEVKRLEQLAADRQAAETTWTELLLSIDASKNAKSLSDLLETSYRELVEIEERQANLGKQKDKVAALAGLAGKESAAIGKLQPLIAGALQRLEGLREEEAVTARARLKPEAADDLLKTFQAKTGRLPPKPLPIPEKDKAAKVEEIASALFDRYVQVEAAKRWDRTLDDRVAAAGLKAEAAVYQDQLARLNAEFAADRRRLRSLTGKGPADAAETDAAEAEADGKAAPSAKGGKKPAADAAAAAEAGIETGGEIGKTRAELLRIRRTGAVVITAKLFGIFVAAFLLPRLLVGLMRRTFGGKTSADGTPGGDTSLVISSLGAFTKAGVWIVAMALALGTLGFDVTAILAGLGIGGLAFGLAAQPMIADIIGTTIIFVEGRFKIGDVIQIGGDEPAKVVGLSWRMTQLKTNDNLVVNIPNRKITEQTIQNRTREGRTYDSIDVTVATTRELGAVLAVIREAMDECKYLVATADRGISVREFGQKGPDKTIKYRFWWYLRDYDLRNRTRDEVFSRICTHLAAENMAGTQITLA